MTLREASERFCISMEKLNYYEENRLIRYETLVDGIPDYTEDEIHKAGIIHALLETGMEINALERYLELLYGKAADKEEQIRILRKQRYKLLEEIHCKQQSLDELDYMIGKLKHCPASQDSL
ncbi:MAG: MerR family transcriptional regulator [Butyrivibrio sp.]|nr:MerR family transcriptional regulator [Butyrivibrio sp.]